MANNIPRVKVREQAPLERIHNFDEVCYGYNREEALLEASRCLNCQNPSCMKACPVSIKIPKFISRIVADDIKGAGAVIAEDSSLPAICGRVCPQENQCEGSCILGKRGEAVAIGKLERFVADTLLDMPAEERCSSAANCTSAKCRPADTTGSASTKSNPAATGNAASTSCSPATTCNAAQTGNAATPCNAASTGNTAQTGNAAAKRIAVIGSGPSSLACAGDLAKMGYDVTIFESLHKAGGVLVYGIPEFRLPKKKIVEREIESIKALGVKIKTNVFIGKTLHISDLIEKEGFSAIFIGTGAGLPRFMNIPGESLNGVFSANEFLTRNNLMRAYLPDADTPIISGKRVCVVGGGNVAMDAARTAARLGSTVTVVYRRTEAELPARAEEVHHAKEEGINFKTLTNPIEICGNEKGWVCGLRCQKMELGEADASGRRAPIAIEGAEEFIETDTVIMALGTAPNPVIARCTPGLATDKRGCIATDENGATSIKGVFAGGDAVTGAATVILAMGAGRKAAAAIHNYCQTQE